MEGSMTSSTGEGDDEEAGHSVSPASTSENQIHPHTQLHPVAQSATCSTTQLHPLRTSPVGDQEFQGHPYTQMHPLTLSSKSSPTHIHPSRMSPTDRHQLSQNGDITCRSSEDHLSAGGMGLSLRFKSTSKSASEFSPFEKSLLKELPASRIASSSSKKSSKISPRSNSTSKSTEVSRLSSIPNRSSIPDRSHSYRDSVIMHRDASTGMLCSMASPIPEDSPIHKPSPVPESSVAMPKVSPTHKASPTHRAGSLGSNPIKKRLARRNINANAVAKEDEEAGKMLKERDEKMMQMMQDGSRMQAIMQQEIQRLSRQKRDVVMRDRVVEPESWKRDVQKQMEEELEQRVREALETPPLERMRRNRYQAKLKRIQQQQMSLSLEECDSFAQTLPSLHNNHQRWDLSETTYSLSDVRNRQNRYSRLAEASRSGNHGDSDTEEDSEDSLGGTNQNQNSSNWRLHPAHRHDNHSGENGAITQEDNPPSDDSGSERARTLSEVRRKTFRQYTAEGFKAAIRKGKSHLKKIENGKYEDKNGVVLTMDGPFWPPECGPLYPKPEHQNFIPDEKELLADAVLDNGRTVHNQRTKRFHPFEATSINVFDSERTSKGTVPHTLPDGCSPSLVFESRFESGNLRQARRVGQFEYNLILKTDMYTPRHTQWFYFRVQRMVPGVAYKFNIINLLKKASLYNHGMRPLIYSEREAAKSSLGWHRTGHHINYGSSYGFHRNPLLHVEMSYYTLSWQTDFAHENDTCYFAHCYPYTFTDLREHIDLLLSDPERRRCTKREVMCESRAGNSCFLLTVTNFSEKQVSRKRGIVVTARVHPGETNASWMMKGLLDYITGSDPVAKDLRKAFVFKIIPMLNPDGVIVGNYRCSLTGRDLNRNFRHPRKESFPTVWHAKEMLEDFSKETEVFVYCDLHGHSRKHNVFIYGCDKNGKEMDAAAFLYQRLFPFLMSREAPDKFSFRGCKFHVKRCKEATGRVVMWRELGINNSFTMEATFCGSKNIRREDAPRHFNLSDFEDLGRHFCEALMVYHKAQENKSLHSELILELTKEITHQVLESRGLLPQRLLTPYGKETEGNMDKDGSCSPLPKVSATETTSDNASPGNDVPIANKAPSSGHDKPAQLVRSLEGRLETMRMIDALSSETIQGCIGILQDLHALKDFAESDSSDSDSTSESEAPHVQEDDKQEEKTKKKKKGKNRSKSMPDGKLHLKLALKAQDQQQGLPSIPTSNPPASKSFQIYALHQDLNVGNIGPDVHPFRMARDGKSHISSYDQRGGDERRPMLYRIVEPRNIEMPLEAEQRIGNREEQGTSRGFLPSIRAYYDVELNPVGDCGNNSQMGKNHPPFVNRYIGRSNAGIPMFAQERLEERAAKRMEAVNKLEQERLERQTTSLQLSEDHDYASLLALSRHINQEDLDQVRYKLDSPSLTVHYNIPGLARHPFQVNFKHGYTHRNSAGLPQGLDLKGDGLQQEMGHKQDVASLHLAPRKLEPMDNVKTRSAGLQLEADNQPFGIGQVQAAFFDQIDSDLRNGVLEADASEQSNRQEVTNHRGGSNISSGGLTNGDSARGAPSLIPGLDGRRTLMQMDLRTFRGDTGENRLNSGRLPSGTPSGRGDFSRMQSAKPYSVSSPWFGARNPQTSSRLNPGGIGAYNRAPLPIRSPRNKQLSAVKKNHMDLIEQQYGRFLSGVDPKRAPSTTAKYLQSLARSMNGSESTNQNKASARSLDRK